jgi:hypothetical protein
VAARDVLDALIRPLAELLAEGGAPGLRYVRMVHRLQTDGDIDPDYVVARWPGGVDRLLPLLRRALPTLPASLIQLRLDLAIDCMLGSLAKQWSGVDLDAHVSAVLDFLTGALEAPARATKTGGPGEA